MDAGMTPEQIASVFASLGRIEQKIDGTTAWMTKHVEDDAVMAADIKKIQLHAARQRGFISALTLFGSVIGSALGWTIHKLLGH